jgi:hypothetical protein
LSFLALAACGEAPKKKAEAEARAAVQTCTSPEQAGARAADITRKLVAQRRKSILTDEEYVRLNNMMSAAFKAWAETQDLTAYCTKLERVATEANLDTPAGAAPAQGR